jgi:hypothetical protein
MQTYPGGIFRSIIINHGEMRERDHTDDGMRVFDNLSQLAI